MRRSDLDLRQWQLVSLPALLSAPQHASSTRFRRNSADVQLAPPPDALSTAMMTMTTMPSEGVET